MLTYSFVDIGSDSLYEYLYKCIKIDILKGNLERDDKLPSKRSFAKHLNISTITVENAYAQLMAEGYIYSLPKRGYFVADLSERPREILQKKPSLVVSNFPQKDPYLADFVSNHTPAENFPFSIWTKLMRSVISEEREALLIPPPSGGIKNLREAIAGHLLQFRGMQVSPEQIIIGAGTEYLYGLLIQLLGRNKIFGLEDPGYQKIAQIYNSNEVTCVHIPMDESGIKMEKLEERKADIIHISPSHHYPTGIVTPINRRYELLQWAQKENSRYIIEDDYDCEFRLTGKPLPALQSIDIMDKVIYMNTFTKSLASTIRISYMVLPKLLLKQYYEKLGFYSCTVSNFEQFTLSRFIQEGYFEKHINRMRNFYRKQRDNLLYQLKDSPIAPFIEIQEEDAGLHFLLLVKTNLSDEELVSKIKSAGIRISCLSQYYYQKEKRKEHILVMNYSGLDPEQVTEVVKQLLVALLPITCK